MSVNELVGRDAELTLLTNFVDDLLTGTGRATLIEGEPGIGKSSIARATATYAEQRGCHVYWAAADELGQTLPLRPILDALHPVNSTAETRLKIIGQLLRGEFGATVDPTTTAAEQVFALIAELCETTPTVLIVDDLQWADPTTTSVWQRLAISVDRLPLLLIGATRPVPQRPEILTIRRVIGERDTIRLDKLPHTAVTSLVTELSEGEPGKSLLTIAADAAGNPLYVTELVAALTRADRLAHTDDGVVEVTTGPVPRSLLAAIADRLDFLRHGPENAAGRRIVGHRVPGR